MVNVSGIIPFYGRTIQVSELFLFAQIDTNGDVLFLVFDTFVEIRYLFIVVNIYER